MNGAANTVGIDLVHIPSFAEQLALPGSRFHSVFSPRELRLAADHPRKDEHLAGRWAAKEAFIKAWSAANYGKPPALSEQALNLAEIEVVPDRWGRPRIELRGEVAQLSGHSVAQVSISHDGPFATAICMLSDAPSAPAP